MDFAYKTASREARRQGRRYKVINDLKFRKSQLLPGERVLVRNVGLTGKNKLADKWEKEVYLVVDQPNRNIPVYVVKREHGRSTRKMLHRNLLVSFMALPASKPSPLDTSVLIDGIQPSPADTTTSIGNTEKADLVGTSSGDEESSAATTDAVNEPARSSEKYVIPQRRPLKILWPSHFIPHQLTLRNQRSYLRKNRRRPTWQTSGDWIP